MSEISSVNSYDNYDVNEIYHPSSTLEEPTVEKKEDTSVKQPVATEEKAQVVAKKAVAKTATKKALPALNLKTISRKEVKKKDAALAKKHLSKNAKNLKWDSARKVVVLDKSGRTRAYQIGRGAAPALFESKKSSEVTAFLKGMKFVAKKPVAKAPVKQTALSALNLKTISRKEVKEKDAALAKKHLSKNARNLKWDKARGVVVLDKSGKTRAYKIGRGSGPALIESKKSSEVTAFLKGMK